MCNSLNYPHYPVNDLINDGGKPIKVKLESIIRNKCMLIIFTSHIIITIEVITFIQW